MKPIDMLNMGPERFEEELPNGNFRITVTPPKWAGDFEGKSVELTLEQYRRYRAWMVTGVLIQNALPDLNSIEREILLNGDPD